MRNGKLQTGEIHLYSSIHFYTCPNGLDGCIQVEQRLCERCYWTSEAAVCSPTREMTSQSNPPPDMFDHYACVWGLQKTPGLGRGSGILIKLEDDIERYVHLETCGPEKS